MKKGEEQKNDNGINKDEMKTSIPFGELHKYYCLNKVYGQHYPFF